MRIPRLGKSKADLGSRLLQLVSRCSRHLAAGDNLDLLLSVHCTMYNNVSPCLVAPLGNSQAAGLPGCVMVTWKLGEPQPLSALTNPIGFSRLSSTRYICQGLLVLEDLLSSRRSQQPPPVPSTAASTFCFPSSKLLLRPSHTVTSVTVTSVIHIPRSAVSGFRSCLRIFFTLARALSNTTRIYGEAQACINLPIPFRCLHFTLRSSLTLDFFVGPLQLWLYAVDNFGLECLYLVSGS
jgi:hypothetical protein